MLNIDEYRRCGDAHADIHVCQPRHKAIGISVSRQFPHRTDRNTPHVGTWIFKQSNHWLTGSFILQLVKGERRSCRIGFLQFSTTPPTHLCASARPPCRRLQVRLEIRELTMPVGTPQ